MISSPGDLRNLLQSRAHKVGIELDDDAPLGHAFNQLEAHGVRLDADKTIAKLLVKLQASLPATHELLEQNISPFWSSCARVESGSHAPLLMGYHPGLSSGPHARALVSQQRILQAQTQGAANDQMVVSNFLRLMLQGTLTPFHLSTGLINPHWTALLARQESQFAIAEELLRGAGGQALLNTPENLLKLGVMFSQIGAEQVVEALQDHPLTQDLLNRVEARDAAVSALVAISIDIPTDDGMLLVHEHTSNFLGISKLDESFDKAFGNISKTPLTNETQHLLKAILHRRLIALTVSGVEANAAHWVSQASTLPLSEQLPDAAANAFWKTLAAHPKSIEGHSKFLARTADSGFLKASIESMGASPWATLMKTLWKSVDDESARLEALGKIDAPLIAQYAPVRKLMLSLVADEIQRPEGSLHFIGRDDISTIWKGYRDGAAGIANSVGLWLAPDYTSEACLSWLALLKHPEYQQAMLLKLPRDPQILAKVDDTLLESALSGDLGL